MKLQTSSSQCRKLSFEHLLLIEERLEDDLMSGNLDHETYIIELSNLLLVCGYTEEEHARLIDERWDSLMKGVNIKSVKIYSA